MSTLTREGYEALIAKHPAYGREVYVETGLLAGDRLVIAAECFNRVYGIELDPYWTEVCRTRTVKLPNVMIFRGDTRRILPVVIQHCVETPTFFYLDAHFCQTDPPIQKSEFPLWVELEAIRARPTKDIVLVDDVHTFGKARPELRFRAAIPEWEKVTKESLLAFFGGQVVDSEERADAFVIWRDGSRKGPE